MKKRKAERRLTLACGLPTDVLGARVTLFGRTSVMAEGQQGVIELSGTRIRLRTRDGLLCVLGEGLAIRELSADAVMISGARIDAASYAPLRES